MTYADALAQLKRVCREGDDYKLRDAVIDEVARLRIVATELNRHRLDQSYRCPWCRADDDLKEQHKPTCPTFTPEGTLR